MSRWLEEFNNHPIHETLKQLRTHANVEIEGLTSDDMAELRRFNRVLDLIEKIIKNIEQL